MPKPHYVVRRSRSGRFNFALITQHGRLTGSVSISLDGKEGAEISRLARNKIQALAKTFAAAAEVALAEKDAPLAKDQRSEATVASGELAT